MTDLKKAKELLVENTCVLVCGETVHASKKTGIAPMLDLLSEEVNLKGFSAADKIVGKAAALLFVLAGVRAVYGEVMSEAGLQVLQKHQVPCSYSTLAPYIINRKGDGICPMEETVQTISDPQAAFHALLEKRRQLQTAK